VDFPAWQGRGARPSEAEQNTGHGWVWPRPDGRTARCGGPGLCNECGNLAAHRAAYERRLWETVEPLLWWDDTDAIRAVLEPVPPVKPEPELPARDERAHSRACGILPHGHGPQCHADCPTCHGVEEMTLRA
jgi:hypothetical protein